MQWNVPSVPCSMNRINGTEYQQKSLVNDDGQVESEVWVLLGCYLYLYMNTKSLKTFRVEKAFGPPAYHVLELNDDQYQFNHFISLSLSL